MAQLLNNMLLTRKKDLLNKWVNLIFDSYHAEGAKFFREQGDPFKNPVGGTIKNETEIVFDQLTGIMDTDILNKSLTNIIKIRSIQEFTPSEAVSFLFQLRDLIGEEISSDATLQIEHNEWLKLNRDIDTIISLAFNIYMDSREKLNSIRINEMKKRFAFVDIRPTRKEKN